jgi:hypothetical protein
MSLNKGCSYDTGLARRQEFHTYLTLPLTNEEIEVPIEFKESLLAALAAMPAKDLPSPDEPALLGLLKVVQNNAQAFSTRHG